jgi:hypothetical protein
MANVLKKKEVQRRSFVFTNDSKNWQFLLLLVRIGAGYIRVIFMSFSSTTIQTKFEFNEM